MLALLLLAAQGDDDRFRRKIAERMSTYSAEALKNQVTNLPGLPSSYTTPMFSGYIDIGETKGLFYWFVESENDPATDPVVLWTNGGPGCSGLGGMLSEQGPFYPSKSGDLVMNAYRWNKIANMIFIEQPAGVGFSYTTQDMSYNDEQSANDNADFLEGWLAMYSQYQSNDLFITSESYGGHYMPTLTREIVNRGKLKNFKGMMVGNPLTYMPFRNYGQYAAAAGRNMFPKPEWDQYENILKCVPNNDARTACQNLEYKFQTYVAGTDPYALDFPTCQNEVVRQNTLSMANVVQRAHKNETHVKKMLKSYFPDIYQPCEDDWLTAYLTRNDVRQALHVRAEDPAWSMCNGNINENYSRVDFNAPMQEIYQSLVANSTVHLHIMIYSGDDDSMCATFGTQEFLWTQGWAVKSPWQSWKSNGQLAGYIVKFGGSGPSPFSFMTVHGAGHMVPSTRPEFGYDIFEGYLAGTWF